MLWDETDDYIEGTTSKFKFLDKIASFDLDSTLITTKSKKKFATTSEDWMFMFNNVVYKLRELIDNKYCIVIITNQAGLKKPEDVTSWIRKIEDIVKVSSLELKVLCSHRKNEFRKPLVKFYDIFFPKTMDKTNSFYCGDAIGRPDDFSDTDYKFALNCKLNFKSPENVFMNDNNILPEIKYINFSKPNNKKFIPENKEMIIMVGFPASGKSSFARKINSNYTNYIIINQDTLKTLAKCKKYTNECLEANKSVIIDSTNPTIFGRNDWIEIAKKFNYIVKIFKMKTSLEHSKHNNVYRSLTSNTELIPDIVYNIYKSKFEEPKITEGVNEIVEVEPEYPDDKKYFMYLM